MKIIIICAVLIIASISDAAPSRNRRSPNDQYGNVVRQQIIRTQTGIPGMGFPTTFGFQNPGGFQTQPDFLNPGMVSFPTTGLGGFPNTGITGYQTSFTQPSIYQIPSYSTDGLMGLPSTSILQVDPGLTTGELYTTGLESSPEISI
ncbi:hypothetical protein HCN44_000101 [Aphidius gifuensis]|uniref:Uncharacterized protein n=1 Tax=Aphidius gifuensis TaxID=684658 RepID=A0A834XP27_APHGI|nr:uncharacterized protein LOC122853990 [Aphidius gifuensis]KAF7990296.1 hypothetical protein HCN44_000101 [Aphidius gifuensis]